jgi:NAD(P)-dependent dehydrogenase (short-subunit alcohol dehydrogenase family)
MAKTVLLTGSSSGIGRATARCFAGHGWNVAFTARDPAVVAGAPRSASLLPLVLDVTDEATIATAVAATRARFGAIDVLVNNAGYGLFGPLEGVSTAELERVFRTNVLGMAAMIRHVLPVMREQKGGTIVNLSSVAGRTADPFASAYSATKFAVEGLSESLRYELQAHRIRVKVIEPGHFKTDFLGRSLRLVRHDAYENELSNWMEWVNRADETAPDPEPVAKAIFGAANDSSDRLRYPVKGRMALAMRGLLPDRMWRSLIGEGMRRRPKPRTPTVPKD